MKRWIFWSLMRFLLCLLLIVGLTLVAEICSASILIDNPSANWLLYNGPNDIKGDLIKTGPGPAAIKFDVAISGSTIINAGILEFRGGVANLHNLSGENSATVNVMGNSILYCSSLDCGTLNIGGIDHYSELVSIPEPATIIIWSLLGVCWTGLAVARRRRFGASQGWTDGNRKAILDIIERNRKYAECDY